MALGRRPKRGVADVSTLLQPRELAEQIDVDRSTVRRWLADGRLPVINTIGSHYRIDPAAVSHLFPTICRAGAEGAARGAPSTRR